MLQIKAAVVAIHNVHHLPFVEDFQKHVASVDLFDWLQFCFGFQVIPATYLPPTRFIVSIVSKGLYCHSKYLVILL